MSRSFFTLALLFVVACGASLADQETGARAALDGRDFAKALQLAEAALADPAAAKDKAAAWRLEQIRLEALANDKQSAELLSSIERLAGSYEKQITAPLMRSLADKLKAAGDTQGAINVLAAGDKRFPSDHEAFLKDIDALKSAGIDDAATEQLRQLGYLD